MAGTTLPGVLLTGIHASRPAANAVGTGTLYSCTTHSLVYQSDGSSWSTWATLGGSPSGSITSSGYTQNTAKLLGRTTASSGAIEEIGTAGALTLSGGTLTGTGIADQGVITYLDGTGASAPGTPASGKARLYVKTDGRFYSKDDAGVEYGPFSSGGGASGPLLYIDTLTHGSKYDDFTNVAGWTALSGGAPSNSAVTSEPYDATCQDLTFSAQSKGFYKSWTGDGTAYLTVWGMTNTTPDPQAASGGMIGLAFTDSSGNGIGCSLYNDNGFYQWVVTGNAYAGTGNATGALRFMDAQAATWPIVYRLVKTGTSYQGSVSFNGGVTWRSPTAQTVAGTTARIVILRMFAGGGTNPVMRVGNFNNA